MENSAFKNLIIGGNDGVSAQLTTGKSYFYFIYLKHAYCHTSWTAPKDKKNHFHLSCKANMDVFWINSFSISVFKSLGWPLNIKIIYGHQGFTSHYEDN